VYIIFLGVPGAGKGTQATTVAEKLKLVYIATGDLFRQAIGGETELGMRVKSYVEAGKLVPDEITIKMVLDRLSAPDAGRGAILDGFPRSIKQAEALDEALGKESKAIDKVILIKVSEEELLKRLGGRWTCPSCQTLYHEVSSPPKVWGKCDRCGARLYQRRDDAPQIVKKRLRVYFAQTAALIDYYTKQGKLIEVDGKGEVAEVSERITQALTQGEFVVR